MANAKSATKFDASLYQSAPREAMSAADVEARASRAAQWAQMVAANPTQVISRGPSAMQVLTETIEQHPEYELTLDGWLTGRLSLAMIDVISTRFGGAGTSTIPDSARLVLNKEGNATLYTTDSDGQAVPTGQEAHLSINEVLRLVGARGNTEQGCNYTPGEVMMSTSRPGDVSFTGNTFVTDCSVTDLSGIEYPFGIKRVFMASLPFILCNTFANPQGQARQLWTSLTGSVEAPQSLTELRIGGAQYHIKRHGGQNPISNTVELAKAARVYLGLARTPIINDAEMLARKFFPILGIKGGNNVEQAVAELASGRSARSVSFTAPSRPSAVPSVQPAAAPAIVLDDWE